MLNTDCCWKNDLIIMQHVFAAIADKYTHWDVVTSTVFALHCRLWLKVNAAVSTGRSGRVEAPRFKRTP